MANNQSRNHSNVHIHKNNNSINQQILFNDKIKTQEVFKKNNSFSEYFKSPSRFSYCSSIC